VASLTVSWIMKLVVENCLAVDAYALARVGVFRAPIGRPWYSEWKDAAGREIFKVDFHLDTSLSVLISYRIGPGSPAFVQRNPLTTLPCKLGGVRHLFLCTGTGNGIRCGRRAAKLYLVDGKWVCRACGNLTYLARQQHDKRKDRLLRDPAALLIALKSDDLRQRLLGVGALKQGIERLSKLARREPSFPDPVRTQG